MSKYIIHKAVEVDKLNKEARLRYSAPGYLETHFIAQPKHDGCNAVLKWDGERIEVQSRTGEKVYALDHLLSFIKYLNLPRGVYLGEAWHENIPFAEISGTFRRQRLDVEKPLLHFVVFDFLTLEEWDAGQSAMPYVDRVERMGSLLNVPYTMKGAPMYPIQSFGKMRDVWPAAEKQDIANKLVAAGGYDGLILRNPDGLWRAGDNGAYGEIIKVKPLIRVSCRVIGWEPGKGKHAGRIGTLLVEYNGKQQGAGTGLKDSERDPARFHDDWFNEVVEIEALGVTEDGYLREPRLKGIRSDVVDAD